MRETPKHVLKYNKWAAYRSILEKQLRPEISEQSIIGLMLGSESNGSQQLCQERNGSKAVGEVKGEMIWSTKSEEIPVLVDDIPTAISAAQRNGGFLLSTSSVRVSHYWSMIPWSGVHRGFYLARNNLALNL